MDVIFFFWIACLGFWKKISTLFRVLSLFYSFLLSSLFASRDTFFATSKGEICVRERERTHTHTRARKEEEEEESRKRLSFRVVVVVVVV